MGGTMSQLDYVGLATALIAYNFVMNWSERWVDTWARREYEGWRRVLNSWVALPGWVWQPMLFVVGNLAATAVFLYWRNSFPVDKRVNRDAIMGLTFANVPLFHMWTPLLLWGPMYWWAAALDSFLVLGTSTAVVALMGVEDAWLPFGIYISYPIFALFVLIATLVFWWYGRDVMEAMSRRNMRPMRTRPVMPEELSPVIMESRYTNGKPARYTRGGGALAQPNPVYY